MSAVRYSAGLEEYIARVVAVGGQWPENVTNLRRVHGKNEPAFRTALEKLVTEAHRASKQQQQQSQPHPQQHAQEQQQYPHQQEAPTSAAKSYPGQQTAPVTPAAGAPNYIPYARDAKPEEKEAAKKRLKGASASTPAATGGPAQAQQQQQPSSQKPYPQAPHQRVQQAHCQQPEQQPKRSHHKQVPKAEPAVSTPYLATQQGPGGTPTINGPPRTGIPSQPLRTGSSLNPSASALRAPKVPAPTPVSQTKDPLPPFYPVSTGFGYMTTYPSRLKLGLTSLMQPITSNGNVVSASLASANLREGPSTSKPTKYKKREISEDIGAATVTASGRRARAKVDYSERTDIPEAPSSSEEGSSEGSDEDDAREEEQKASRANRALKRSGVSIAALASPAPSAASSSSAQKKRKRDRDGTEDVGGGGKSWLGQDPPGDLILVQPAVRHIIPYVSEDELRVRAQDKALYVPIRIDLDTDTVRIRDTFTWNLRERSITPDVFARIFCYDAQIESETYSSAISQQIRAQLDEFTGVAEVSLLTPEQEADAHEADIRAILNIDVQIGTLHLVDRVEWDLTSSLTPEDFAKQMCADLGLGGEAVMLVSNAVHEELLRLKKDVLELGLLGRSTAEGANATLRERGLGGPRKLESVWRDWNEAKMFGPHVEILTPEDIDALESEKDRNPRRLKKSEAQIAAMNRERAGRRR